MRADRLVLVPVEKIRTESWFSRASTTPCIIWALFRSTGWVLREGGREEGWREEGGLVGGRVGGREGGEGGRGGREGGRGGREGGREGREGGEGGRVGGRVGGRGEGGREGGEGEMKTTIVSHMYMYMYIHTLCQIVAGYIYCMCDLSCTANSQDSNSIWDRGCSLCLRTRPGSIHYHTPGNPGDCCGSADRCLEEREECTTIWTSV